MTRLMIDVLFDTLVTVLCIGLFLLTYFTLTSFPPIPDNLWMALSVPFLGLFALMSTFYVSFGNYRKPVAYFTYNELPLGMNKSDFWERNIKYYFPKVAIHSFFITIFYFFTSASLQPIIFYLIFAFCYYLNRVILLEKKIKEKRVR